MKDKNKGNKKKEKDVESENLIKITGGKNTKNEFNDEDTVAIFKKN